MPSAFVVDFGNESLLIDCGEGTQYQMLKYKVKKSRLKYILISHLHGDHYFGLIGLLNSLNHEGRNEPLVLIGPRGLSEILSVQLRYSGSLLGFHVDFIETNPEIPQTIYSNDKITIKTFPLKHRIACTGFVISEKPQKRKILAEKLPVNFPIAYFKLLQEGKDIKDELSGKIYLNAEYTNDPEPPKTLAYCSDTAYFPEVIPHISNAGLLYHEATFEESLKSRAKLTMHSTAKEAATIAKDANVKRLIIGHFSSRYKILDDILTEAKAVFHDTELSEEGKFFQL